MFVLVRFCARSCESRCTRSCEGLCARSCEVFVFVLVRSLCSFL